MTTMRQRTKVFLLTKEEIGHGTPNCSKGVSCPTNTSVETISPKSSLEKSNVPKTVRKCVPFVKPKIGGIAALKNKM